jgi:hypothetical protein
MKTIETFLARVTKMTASMPDTALTIPVETPRSLTPSQPAVTSDNFAFTAGTALAGWAMSGLKSKVLGSDIMGINGDGRPDSAPPSQSRFGKTTDTPDELRGLGSQGDVDPWKDEQFDDDWTSKPKPHARQKSAPVMQPRGGMKLPTKAKKSVVEQVVEEEQRKSVDEDASGAWGLEDWNDDPKDDGWGFDD